MQHEAPGTITILMADDDADDRMMAADAMRESRLGTKALRLQRFGLPLHLIEVF